MVKQSVSDKVELKWSLIPSIGLEVIIEIAKIESNAKSNRNQTKPKQN